MLRAILAAMGCACDKEKSVVVAGDRRFRIIKQIAEGGFSLVFVAEEGSGRRRKQYAVKRITCHSKEELDRAKLEAELHRNTADNSNVLMLEAVTFDEASHNRHMLYQADGGDPMLTTVVSMVFPYYKRGTLLEELQLRRVTCDYLPERCVLRLFVGVCYGLLALHRLHPTPYCHRDLKPGNVLLSSASDSDDVTPVLMDLGSAAPARLRVANAAEAQRLRDDAAEHCTMPYRPPEFFQVQTGDSFDERSDVWSLGCLLYALCFFRSPFEDAYERGDSLALAVLSANIVIPETSPYSDKLHQLIKRLLKVELPERPYVPEIISTVDDILKRTETV